jgi:hypothetical protein
MWNLDLKKRKADMNVNRGYWGGRQKEWVLGLCDYGQYITGMYEN